MVASNTTESQIGDTYLALLDAFKEAIGRVIGKQATLADGEAIIRASISVIASTFISAYSTPDSDSGVIEATNEVLCTQLHEKTMMLSLAAKAAFKAEQEGKFKEWAEMDTLEAIADMLAQAKKSTREVFEKDDEA